MRNSFPLVVVASRALDHDAMNLEDQKAFRRTRLAQLMDELGQKQLSELTKIPAAQLYQMSKAVGKQARPVSDKKVAQIEARTGRPGWFFPPHVIDTPKKKHGKESPGWVAKLSPKQLLANSLVMDHLPHLTDEQAGALISLLEAFAATHKGKKSGQAHATTKEKEHR